MCFETAALNGVAVFLSLIRLTQNTQTPRFLTAPLCVTARNEAVSFLQKFAKFALPFHFFITFAHNKTKV